SPSSQMGTCRVISSPTSTAGTASPSSPSAQTNTSDNAVSSRVYEQLTVPLSSISPLGSSCARRDVPLQEQPPSPLRTIVHAMTSSPLPRVGNVFPPNVRSV